MNSLPSLRYPSIPVSYTHLRAHETPEQLVCRLLLEKGGFTGHWKTSGEKISMIQTHENNKPKKDRMEGYRKDGKLFMTHRNQSIDLPYIFAKAN